MNKHFPIQFLLMIPGTALAAAAILADVIRGGKLLADWGSGQSVLLFCGIVAMVLGWMVHRKAVRDQARYGRKYQRTVTFIVVPVAVCLIAPLLAAEGIARLFDEPYEPAGSYRQRDPQFGFSLAPNREYHVISRPKQFDIQIRIDAFGFRCGPGETQVSPASADVIIVGDSHPFGFGIDEDKTLAAQLQQLCEKASQPIKALNAGVPGFGPGQCLLKIQSLTGIKPNSTIVLFINPINDLVNLSSAVDYHYPKPHPVLQTDGALNFHPAPRKWSGGGFFFSAPFQSLNQYFGLSERAPMFDSALVRQMTRLFSEADNSHRRVLLEDNTTIDQFLQEDIQRIESELNLYASRYWPEMPRFGQERKELLKIATAVFKKIHEVTEERQLNLIAIVAPEADEFQKYSKQFHRAVQSRWKKDEIQIGWSRQAVLTALANAEIATITPDYRSETYQHLDIESLFIPRDNHTSALGHNLISNELFQALVVRSWLPLTPSETPAALKE